MSRTDRLGRIEDSLKHGIIVQVLHSVKYKDKPCCFVTADHGEDSGRIEGAILFPQQVKELIGLLEKYLRVIDKS